MTEAVSDRLLRLPFYFDLTEAEQRRVIDGVRSFRGPAGRPRTGWRTSPPQGGVREFDLERVRAW